MPAAAPLQVITADLFDPVHASIVVALTDAYARDSQGMGAALPEGHGDRLIAGLRAHPAAHVLIGLLGDEPVALATCFLGFSTFAAQPLLNLHDFAVLPNHRGAGLGAQMLVAVTEKARSLGCCKVTLEVYEGNPARRLYDRAGYETVATFMTTRL